MRRFLKCSEQGGLEEIPGWEPKAWVNIESPDDQDYELIDNKLKIPRDFIDDIADPDERPRIERNEEGWTFTIIRIPLKAFNHDSARFFTVPMGIIERGDVRATICMYRTELVPDLIAHTRQKNIRICSDSDLILRLMFSATFWFLKYLKDINDEVNHMSKTLRRSIRNDDLIAMMGLQRVLVYFNTSIKGNELLLDRLTKVFGQEIDQDLIDDIEVEIKQADNTVVVYTDILSGMMDTYASIISNNVNDIMKKMTGVSIILMFPTLIASFYGMNVPVMGGSSSLSFWLIAAGSFALAAILYFVLRKIRWL